MKSQWIGFHSTLGTGLQAFLDHKRALGCRFRTEEMTLRLFDRFLVEQHVTTIDAISPALMDTFLASRKRTSPQSYNHLLQTLARAFKWLAARGLGPPPPRAKPRRATRTRIPFLFDPSTARQLLELAGSLPECPSTPRRAQTYRTIFALLYALGLRVGEVARLRVGDFDMRRRLLTVRNTKFAKSRLVPFGPNITTLVTGYIQLQSQQRGSLAETMPLFSFRKQQPVHPSVISQTFHELVPRLGLRVPDGTAPPTVHCLRHSFAVGTLLRWYRSGVDPNSRLLQLSTFLGHVHPTSTAVYLTITTELLAEANQRFERWATPLIVEVRP
jgi:integrase